MRNISASQWLRNPELEVVEARKEGVYGNNFVLYADEIPLPGDEDETAGPKKPKRTASAGGAR